MADFILLFRRQAIKCLKRESPTRRNFSGDIYGFRVLWRILMQAGLVFFHFFALIYCLRIIILRLWTWGFRLLFSVKSIVQLFAISRRALYGSLVFDALCVAKVGGRYWVSVTIFIIWDQIKFSFLRLGVGVTNITREWITGVALLEWESCHSWNKSKLRSGRVSSVLKTRQVSSSLSSRRRLFMSLGTKIL